MKILFICSRETDYLQDLTYAGLRDVVGKDSVVEFPYQWSYHREKKYFWSKRLEYPRNLGFMEDNQFNSLNDLDRSRTVQKLKKNEFDLVILGCAKPDALRTLESVIGYVNVPWIFIDGGDLSEIGGDFKRLGGDELLNQFHSLSFKNPPALIFKRELPLGANFEKVFPLPFSMHASKVPVLAIDSPKDKEVVFWAVESSPVRREAFHLLQDRYDCEDNGTVSGQKFRAYKRRGKSYFQALNESKIALSLSGEGFDTLRYWEIPACGALLLSETPSIQIPNNFKNKTSAVFCDRSLSNLTDIIDYYLANDKEREEISLAGQKHLLQYHTHLVRANYILEVIQKHLGKV